MLNTFKLPIHSQISYIVKSILELHQFSIKLEQLKTWKHSIFICKCNINNLLPRQN